MPRESHGPRNLAGYSPKGYKESDTTKHTHTHTHTHLALKIKNLYTLWEFPGGPVVRTLLSLLRVWVPPLVRELRSHKSHDKEK